MVDINIVRKACANDYKRRKCDDGYALEGFFLDVYNDILTGDLVVTYDSNQVLDFIKTYKLNIKTNVSDNKRLWKVIDKDNLEVVSESLDEAVYRYVSQLTI